MGTHADELDESGGASESEERAKKIYSVLSKRFADREKGVENRLAAISKLLSVIDPRDDPTIEVKDQKRKYKALAPKIKAKIETLHREASALRLQRRCWISLPDRVIPVSSLDLRNFDMLKGDILKSLGEVSPSGRYFPELDEEVGPTPSKPIPPPLFFKGNRLFAGVAKLTMTMPLVAASLVQCAGFYPRTGNS